MLWTLLEILGFATGVGAVALAARNDVRTYPVGIAQVLLYLAIFTDARLYADAGLQVFFLVVQVVGWRAWLRGGPGGTERPIAHAPRRWLLATLALVVLAAWALVPVLRAAHGAYPVPDASVTALSVAAQCLLAARWLENWYLWIVTDLIAIPLYAARELYLTAVLYVVFLVLCVGGLRHWRRLLAERAP